MPNDIIKQIELDDGTTYDIVDNRLTKIFTGTCSTAASTAAKEVTCSGFTSDDLAVGVIVFVTFTNTNEAAVSSITLSVNSTTAKGIRYMRNAQEQTLPTTGYIKANMTYRFTYNGTYWVCDTDYDTNEVSTLPRIRNLTVDAQSSDLYRYQLCAFTSDYEVMPFNGYDNKTNPVTDPKTFNSNAFDPFKGFLYNTSSTATTAGNVFEESALAYAAQLNARYSFNLKSSGTAGVDGLTSGSPIYLKALYNNLTRTAILTQDLSSSNFLVKSGLVESLPSSNPNAGLADNTEYIYIYLGVAYSLYQINMPLENTVYKWNPVTKKCESFVKTLQSVGECCLKTSTNIAIDLSYSQKDFKITVYGNLPSATVSSLGDKSLYLAFGSSPTNALWASIDYSPIVTLNKYDSATGDRIVVYAKITQSTTAGEGSLAKFTLLYATVNEAYVSNPPISLLADADIEFSFYIKRTNLT